MWKVLVYLFIVLGKKFVLGIASVLAAVVLIVFAAVNHNVDIPVSNLDNKKVVIDPGHGGMDGGSVSDGGDTEKEINLAIAMKLKKIFEDNGYTVVMTRETDVSLNENSDASVRKQKNSDLKKRAEIANESGAGLFISVHVNKYESAEIFGAQTFYSKDDEAGKLYAESVMETLRELNPKNKRLAKTHPSKNLVFQNLKIPGVLVECGFISNPDDLLNLKNDEYQQKTAEAIYNGVVNLSN